jgi:predicted LPLAT superfamily acyltransferase
MSGELARDKETGRPGWLEVRERGSVLGIKFAVVLATTFGRPPARLLARILALYYTLFAKNARRAAQAFRKRVGASPGFRGAYRQILRFAQCTVDALFLIRGKTKYFRVSRNGHKHLEQLRESGQGAILLGAHIGSFYAMRMQGEQESLPIYPVVYLKNARRINDALEALDPSSKARLIEMEDGVNFMLKIRQKLEQGGLVAVLADRVPPGGKSVEVDFLGGRARFPVGPYVLAATLGCPVYFTAGIYHDPDHYELFCEPFAERVRLPRKDREGALRQYAQQYADHLERFCRRNPDNWFNFYDFWEER